jgi:Tol biopolymer transport system component
MPATLADAIVFKSSRALDGSDAANVNGTSNIWTMNADGSGATPLTKLTANQPQACCSVLGLRPIWSPDCSKIIFESERALNGSDAASPSLIFNIWVMNADGSGQMPLTKLMAAGASSSKPAWSPGGSRIAFTSSRALNGSDDESRPQELTASNLRVRQMVARLFLPQAVHWTAAIRGCQTLAH